jgi:dephospho-CoA kinase
MPYGACTSDKDRHKWKRIEGWRYLPPWAATASNSSQTPAMKVLGLTGGIGMGKSTSAGLFRAGGVPVVDTDDLARQVVEPGQPALAEVVAAFGPQIIGSDGRLRREELARLVFADPVARQRLEAILHPPIRERWRAQAEVWRSEGHAFAVVVIPLLFETKAEAELDATICVACSVPTQQERLRARGWSPEQIEQRLQAQWPTDQKIARSDYLIWTEAGLDVHAAQIEQILRRLAP